MTDTDRERKRYPVDLALERILGKKRGADKQGIGDEGTELRLAIDQHLRDIIANERLREGGPSRR